MEKREKKREVGGGDSQVVMRLPSARVELAVRACAHFTGEGTEGQQSAESLS